MSHLIPSTLSRAARFWRTDVYAKGPAGALQTGLRFLRLAMRWRAYGRWRRVLSGPTTHAIIAIYPRIVYLPSFSYLFAGATWRQRLAMASAHYAFLNRTHDAAFFARVISIDGLTLWQQAHGGRSMSIGLFGPDLVSRHHEGDLTLTFSVEGSTLCRVAFSIIVSDAVPDVGPPERHVIYVGQVQGAAGAYAAMREASQALHAVAPRDILMTALAGVASAWGIDTLLGVAGDQLLSKQALLNSSSRFDYDRFWRDHGACVGTQGHHVMRLPFVEKPLSAIVMRHRGRTLSKRRFKQTLSVDVATALRAYLKVR